MFGILDAWRASRACSAAGESEPGRVACRIELTEVDGSNSEQSALGDAKVADPRLLWKGSRRAKVVTCERRPTPGGDPDPVRCHRQRGRTPITLRRSNTRRDHEH